jgi:hypothetical protein
VAGANFRIKGKKRIRPQLIPSLDALLCKAIVSPLRSRGQISKSINAGYYVLSSHLTVYLLVTVYTLYTLVGINQCVPLLKRGWGK